ncbi:hypothetical protein GVAV_000395 [Gurleya vavrai]
MLVSFKEWLCKYFSFYTSLNKENNKIYIEKKPKANVLDNISADINFNNSIYIKRDCNKFEFEANDYDLTYLKEIGKNPLDYFNQPKNNLMYHKVDIFIKQEFSDISFYKENHRIIFEIDFNMEIENFYISIPYTDRTINVIKQFGISNKESINLDNLLFILYINECILDCFLIKNNHHLELLLGENYVNLGLPKADFPGQFDKIHKSTMYTQCLKDNKDVILKYSFTKVYRNFKIFTALLIDLYGPFFLLTKKNLEDMYENFDNTKNEFFKYFHSLLNTQFNISVKADNYLFNNSEENLSNLKKASAMKNKKFLTEKLLEKKILNHQMLDSNANQMYLISNFLIDKERIEYLKGINPSFIESYRFALSDFDQYNYIEYFSANALKNLSINILISESISLTKFYKNKHRLLFEIDFGLYNKKFVISAPYAQFAINKMIEYKLNKKNKVFNKLNFIIRLFEYIDDIYILSNGIDLKYSTVPGHVKFGFSKKVNDTQVDRFYNHLAFKCCIKRKDDNLFDYNLGEMLQGHMLLTYLFYNFNPIMYLDNNDFQKNCLSKLFLDEYNLYDVITQFLNADYNYMVIADESIFTNINNEDIEKIKII